MFGGYGNQWNSGPRGRRGGGGGAWDWFGGPGPGPGAGGGGGWPFGPGGPQGGGRGGRMFGHGDLKYVLLSLLAEKPRHGYEIIRDLEERSGGIYSPSPGTVYPTLTLLEDMGYARSTSEEGSSRKVYEITDEGRRYLDENRTVVDEIFGRVNDAGSFVFGAPVTVLGPAFAALGRVALREAIKHQGDEAWVQRAREILERATRELEGSN